MNGVVRGGAFSSQLLVLALLASSFAISCTSVPQASPGTSTEPPSSTTAMVATATSPWPSQSAIPFATSTVAVPSPSPMSGRTPSTSPSPMPVPTGYSVHIANGLNPHWKAQDAAAKVLGWISVNERVYGRVVAPAQILSVEALRGRDVPRSMSGPYGGLPIAWVVHANGTFVNEHGPGLYSHWFFTEAWEVFDDNGDGQGEALNNSDGQVVTPPPITPHPSGACPLRLNIVNDYDVDIVALVNDDLAVTVEAGKTYLVDEWTTSQLTPPPPPWHVVLTYRPANVQFFETTVYPPTDQQLTITSTGVTQGPYGATGC